MTDLIGLKLRALLNGLDPREYLRTATLAALTGETVPLPHEIVAKAAT